jgi:glycerol uptake operon antiterminator
VQNREFLGPVVPGCYFKTEVLKQPQLPKKLFYDSVRLLVNILVKRKKRVSPPEFLKLLEQTPVILAVKSMEGLTQCLQENCGIIFILFGSILSIPGIVAQIKEAGKIAMVHLDLIDGLNAHDVAVDFLAENTWADGVISTRGNVLKNAQNKQLLAVQRFFVLDSMSLINIEKQLPLHHADAIEILPGLMPKIIRRIAGFTQKPIIAGGLISDREDVRLALEAGAVSVSTSNIALL